MTAFIVFIAIILLVILWPAIMRAVAPYIQNWIMGRVEDRFRKMAGMPTRKEEKRAAKQRAKNGGRAAEAFRKASRSSRGAHGPHDPIIPKEYAEDVDFVEIKTFSHTEVVAESKDGNEQLVYESQVEDVEFIEIKREATDEDSLHHRP